jgi:hypothetical protein
MWAGWMSWLCSIVILVTSFGPIRKLAYEVFRWAHWFFIPMMILASAHFNNTFCFFQVRMLVYK